MVSGVVYKLSQGGGGKEPERWFNFKQGGQWPPQGEEGL